MAKIGDTVRYLNAVGGGRIVKIDGQIAYVDEDGFETPVLLKECVVVSAAETQPQRKEVTSPKKTQTPAPAPSKLKETPAPATTAYQAPLPPVKETPEGELLNIVLAYEPHDIKSLSTTRFDAVLVNDSNYHIYYTYLTRADEDRQWTARSTGMIEPATQLVVDEITAADLPSMDRIAIQYIAFKQNGKFNIKAPTGIEYRLDTTKFARLHCFHSNPYFDTQVIAVDIVKNDIPCRPQLIDARRMEEAMKSKAKADMRQSNRHKAAPAVTEGPLVVDLHINELIDTTSGMSNADILERQMDEFRSVMDDNLRRKGTDIVFIHGKGEGVLRKAILTEMKRRYPNCDVQDASFREYGFGATRVIIR